MNIELQERILKDLELFLRGHMDIIDHMTGEELKNFRNDFILRACDFYKVLPENVGFAVKHGRVRFIR